VAVFVDGSEESEKAFQKALHFVRPHDIFFLVHIPVPINGLIKGIILAETLDSSLLVEAETKIIEGSKSLVESYKKPLKELKVTHVYAVSIQPRELGVNETALKFLEKRRIDVAFVGTRGHGALTSLLMGSFSRYLVHHAPCSVMVVR